MNSKDTSIPAIRVLAPTATAMRLSRRGFLGGMGIAATGALLSACAATPGTSVAPAAAAAPVQLGTELNFFNWASYDDPATVKSYTTKTGVNIRLDVYNSNEEAIAKLGAAAGTGGYDIFVPTGVYIPQIAQAGLLEKLDHSKLPNLAKVDPAFLNQAWDKDNTYSVCKDWGSTGFLYDTKVIKRDLKTWSDFVDAMQNEASGKTSIMDSPNYLAGLYAWRTGMDWTSTDAGFLDDVEKFILNDVAPHINAYESYPGAALAQGKSALMMCWNGDARQGLMAVHASDPERYRWVLGAPTTELWMDNWTILKGAKHLDAAYSWINYVLDPVVSYKELQFTGYNTGIAGLREKAKADKLPLSEMIFFTDQQVATFKSGALNSGTDRLVQILTKAKAASAK
ncbi:polyamine ABC transporter substrate-binding protein [Arthrobacter oryzae]|uniref:Spermidine/putrescine-binding protein n=1 Tax=Arthrobacter oryzae TaxID=409290 RepID=A0A495ESZ3_9MICC|nr:spermidine/putrescine ABC transporter substrate-binding protein [Arthrobacter oryzae]RKR20098.1 spermidine/putrescine-binding protein [Arthrobacter oryzae]